MKSWLVGLLFVIGMLLSVAASACGGGDGSGGDELSLEQYFEEVASIIESLEERTATLDQPLEREFDSEAEQIEASRDAFATVLPVFEDFVNDLDGLNPPVEVEDAHDELLAGLGDLVGGVEELIDQLEGIESASEFSDLLLAPDSAFGSAVGKLAAACLQLETIADDNGIDAAVLECEV